MFFILIHVFFLNVLILKKKYTANSQGGILLLVVENVRILSRFIRLDTLKRVRKYNVPEVLNVHMNESEKKIFFFRRIFFQAVKN